MGGWWSELDRLLRGETTRSAALRRGTISLAAGRLTVLIVVLGMAYGACMGGFALFRSEEPSLLQWAATTVKLPALFLLTLAVTFPSLYVFNALVGSRLELAALLKLLIAQLAVMVTVLASLGPIVAFFAVSTTSYAFMVLLNVAVFAVSGLLGSTFLLQTLQRLSDALKPAPFEVEPGGPPAVEPEPGPLERPEGQVWSRHVTVVFRCWLMLFGLVGAQMGWVLRPFIGAPGQRFTWFRPRESNFFEAVWRAVQGLFG